MTALTYAAQNGHHECVDILIRAGAEVNKVTTLTPVMAAVRGQQCEVIRSLMHAGADVNHRAVSNKEFPGLPYFTGATALTAACTLGFPDCVQVLIEEGADVNATDDDGIMAAECVVTGGNMTDRRLRCLEVLLGRGAHVREALNGHFIAAGRVNRRAVMLLLAAGERLNTEEAKEVGARLPPEWDESHPHPEVPEHFLYMRTHLNLKHMCREVVRRRMLEVRGDLNLFIQVPRLQLPATITSYLLYDMSLNL